MTTKSYHGFTVEVLRHYNCGSCSKWWSIGDHQAPGAVLHCPHCGAAGEPVDKAELDCIRQGLPPKG